MPENLLVWLHGVCLVVHLGGCVAYIYVGPGGNTKNRRRFGQVGKNSHAGRSNRKIKPGLGQRCTQILAGDLNRLIFSPH